MSEFKRLRSDAGFSVRRATPEEIFPLRMQVLIAGTNRDHPVFPGDSDEGTLHYGVFSEHHAELGALCITRMNPAPFVGDPTRHEPAWQLRSMATHPDFRGRGLGRLLLEAIEAEFRERGDRLPWWCNARLGAVGFYAKLGWEVVSEEFDIPGVGPHYRMLRRFPSDATLR